MLEWVLIFRAGVDIRCCVIIYYYYIIYYYILYYYYIISYTILSSSSNLSSVLSSNPSPPPTFLSSSFSLPFLLFLFFLTQQAFPIFILYLSVLTYTYLYSSIYLLSSQYSFPIFPPPLSFIYHPLPTSHSFYTCRYLHILIYIHLLFSFLILPINSSSSFSLLFLTFPIFQSLPLHNIHSILVGTYIYLFIFQPQSE
jgi:hypothetical protein